MAEIDEDVAWKVACSKDTIISYQGFLKQFPKSMRVTAAQMRIDRLQDCASDDKSFSAGGGASLAGFLLVSCRKLLLNVTKVILLLIGIGFGVIIVNFEWIRRLGFLPYDRRFDVVDYKIIIALIISIVVAVCGAFAQRYLLKRTVSVINLLIVFIFLFSVVMACIFSYRGALLFETLVGPISLENEINRYVNKHGKPPENLGQFVPPHAMGGGFWYCIDNEKALLISTRFISGDTYYSTKNKHYGFRDCDHVSDDYPKMGVYNCALYRYGEDGAWSSSSFIAIDASKYQVDQQSLDRIRSVMEKFSNTSGSDLIVEALTASKCHSGGS